MTTTTTTTTAAALYEALDDDARELTLYAENTSELYAQRQSIIKNLSRRIAKGTYRADLAPKLWRYWTDAAARLYRRDVAEPRSTLFPPAVRQAAADYLAASEHAAILNGEYDHLA